MAEVISIALETLRDLLLEEAKFLVGVGGEVRTLQSQLKEINSLLIDADSQQHQTQSVRNWISEIRDLAYRAEDAIASYAVRVSSDARGGALQPLLRRFSRVLSCFSLHQLGHEISDIRSQLARVTESMRSYGMRSIIDGLETSAADDGHNLIWKTFPDFEIGDCFVGKEDELNRLVALLAVGDYQQHRVISIWGMGGIGKTTIAKKVFDRMKQSKNFDSFAWVCITQQCRIRTVLESVLKQLIPEKGEGVSNLSDEQLIMQLCEIQRAYRCLIVLDDLWETSHWNGFKHAFLVQDLKNKILITTRKQNVADIGFSVELGLLSMDEAWELLKKKSFPHGSDQDFALQERIQKIGNEMVWKCGFLPLAICLLGGVLSKKSSMREWELVNANINSSIYSRREGQDRVANSIEQVLHLSYDDLPYYLKPCFLYLAILTEDEEIIPMDLYRRWIAQGMISNDNIQGQDETLPEIAEIYLTELASRCIVQVEFGVEDGSVLTQKYRTCKLHDVVLELSIKMARKENFGAQILQYQGGRFSTLLQKAFSCMKTRHLVIHFQKELQVEEHDDDPAIPGGKHLRSLEMKSHIYGKTIEFPAHSIADHLHKFKMLKSLVIERFKFAGRKFPRGITNLVHLKYLGLRDCELDELPSSITNLVYMDTLFLSGSWNIRVPDVLNKLLRLKHLILPFYDKKTIGNYRMSLDVGDELETLWWFDSSVHELKSISKMKNLRRFSGVLSDNESLSAVINVIATEWPKLQYCVVKIKQGCEFTTSSEDGQRRLKQVFTCPNLYYLMIHVELGKQLAECGSHIINSNLVELTLENSEIEDDPMVILGKLPSLRKLFLRQRSYVGEQLACPASSFPRLRVVVFSFLPNWREWRVEEGGMCMPLLHEIHLHYCPSFQKLPNGLIFISTLRTLTVTGMSELGTRVSKFGEDIHKVSHVPSVIIHN